MRIDQTSRVWRGQLKVLRRDRRPAVVDVLYVKSEVEFRQLLRQRRIHESSAAVVGSLTGRRIEPLQGVLRSACRTNDIDDSRAGGRGGDRPRTCFVV